MTIITEPYSYPNLKNSFFEIGKFAHEISKKVANLTIRTMVESNKPMDLYSSAFFCYEDSSEFALLNCQSITDDDFNEEANAIHQHIFLKRRDCRVVVLTSCGIATFHSSENEPFQILLTIVLTGDQKCIMAVSQSNILNEFESEPDSIEFADIPNSYGLGLINACLSSNKKLKSSNNDAFVSNHNESFLKKETVPLSQSNKSDYSFEYVGKLKGYKITDCHIRGVEKIVVPIELDDGVHGTLKVKSIGDDAFSFNGAKSIILPNTIVEIGEGAFSYCYFASLIIPDSVRRIGFYAFDGCDSLKKLTIGKNIKELENIGYCEKLKSVIFKGTKEQWESLLVAFDCNCVIHCKDGDIHC